MGVRKTNGSGRSWSDAQHRELLAELEKPGAAHRVEKFRCEVVTPLYGGGVRAREVDTRMPIRATAIRGQLRFWWRLLNRLDDNGKPYPSQHVFERERAIWGGLGDKDTLAKSKVIVRVGAVSRSAPLFAASSYDARGKMIWDARLKPVEYAAFPMKGTFDRDQGIVDEDPSKLHPAGLRFELALSAGPDLTDAKWQSVLESVRWWAAFGGVGARARRGFGAVDVNDASGVQLAPPSSEAIAKCGCTLTLGTAKGDQDAALQAWQAAIRCLHTFRQGIGEGRAEKEQDGKRYPGYSHWPEAHAIRNATGRAAKRDAQRKLYSHKAGQVFPRAMFGMPIITHYKDEKRGDPKDTELLPLSKGSGEAHTRMASPLILRPYKEGNRWRPAALLLPHAHLRDLGLRLQYPGGKKIRDFNAGQWWTPEQARHIEPMRNRDDDPLQAFLAYFMEQEPVSEDAPAVDPGPASGGSAQGLPPATGPVQLVLERPRLKWEKRNGTLTLEPREKHKPIYLLGEEAQRCLQALGERSRQYVLSLQYPHFNKLTITLENGRFVSLREHEA